MKVGVLGTGAVGQALGSKLVSLGHDVVMGSRQAGNEKAVAWAATAGGTAGEGNFATAAAFGDIVVNATPGAVSLAVLTAAGAENLAGKVLVDVANPLDSSRGMPPRLTVCNTDSLGEQIQRQFPEALVVKALNTVNADVMVTPGVVGGSHTVFVAGNHAAAKAQVVDMLMSFGWPPGDILDLGDIAGARGMEMYLPLWVRLWQTLGTSDLNVKVVIGT